MSGNRIASDGNVALISMYKVLQNGWVPPTFVSEEEYKTVKQANDQYDPMTAFCGIGCSFAGKLWGGYARTIGRNYAKEAHNNLMKQLPKIKDVDFIYGLFDSHFPQDMLVYCDPPYQGTTQYNGFSGFDHDLFWNVMRRWTETNVVVISEYSAPDDFKCVAEFASQIGLATERGKPKRAERIFMLK